jgi:hypothetical protein
MVDASGTKKEQSGTESPGGAGISDSAIKVCRPLFGRFIGATVLMT